LLADLLLSYPSTPHYVEHQKAKRELSTQRVRTNYHRGLEQTVTISIIQGEKEIIL
jgi:hypothetical protein